VTTALLGSRGARWQAAAAILLLFSAGYVPKSPGRLLSLALGFVMLSRALIAMVDPEPARPAQAAPPDAG
jgi:hypothetical protein